MNEWIDPKPTEYSGTAFRSRLEASWAANLDHYGIRWQYEPATVTLESGTWYLPDFWLPELSTVIEVKGAHMERAEKARELAAQVARDVIVLFGYAPAWNRGAAGEPESLMRWEDAAGYNSLFTRCLACGSHQWCRLRASLDCRKCGERFTGHLAGPHDAVEFGGGRDIQFSLSFLFGSPESAALCPGSGSRSAPIPTRRSSRRGMMRSACTSAAVRTPPSI